MNSQVFDPERAEWSQLTDGVRAAQIHEDEERGNSLMAVKVDPGATVPLHRHDVGEAIVVLEGDYSDGTYEAEAGEVVYLGEGTEHTVSSDGGATLILSWFGNVDFVE